MFIADGCLFYWPFDSDSKNLVEPHNATRVVLSTGPTELTACKTINDQNQEVDFIFASCDQPSVIGFKNQKLNFCSVNIQGVSVCGMFSTPSYRALVICLASN